MNNTNIRKDAENWCRIEFIEAPLLASLEAINRNLKGQAQLIEEEFERLMKEFFEAKSDLEEFLEANSKTKNKTNALSKGSLLDVLKDILTIYKKLSPQIFSELNEKRICINKLKDTIHEGMECITATNRNENYLYTSKYPPSGY